MNLCEPSFVPAEYRQASSIFIDNVMPQLLSWYQQGLQTALITLVNVEGSSPRAVGSQMAVNERGDYVGLISGGCVEPALVSEALRCIQHASTRLIRYGKGSDYFDIQLPCGSGIDVLIASLRQTDWLQQLVRNLHHRIPTIWQVDAAGDMTCRTFCCATEQDAHHPKSISENPQWTRTETEKNFASFEKHFQPIAQVMVIGSGAIFETFIRMACDFEFEVTAISTVFKSSDHVQPLSLTGREPRREALTSPDAFDVARLDEWSYLIFLTHDHDCEIPILSRALQTPVKYIGLLGSKATHAKRIDTLVTMGFSDENLLKMKGPIGLDIGASTPPEIALSVMAELVQIQKQYK